jgi:hypothetical protein
MAHCLVFGWYFCLSQIESLKYKTDHMKNEKYNHGKQENTDTLLHNE